MAPTGIILGDTNGLRISLVCNPFVSPKIMPVGAIASSRSIYATIPLAMDGPVYWILWTDNPSNR
ncbi:MAG: hypothetical protein E5299_00003 [Burkholderia gladioli]|uniref:Competence protein ComEC n=1 Tax=Burkholderia gladioli TaxID=28095 RepID=A0A2Z4XFZ9_BURGA|nr:competence protein ComEC [Burkholderia gladioli]KAF1018222.1 MAG: hypothetical protein E5299_00003 [Burkholderia gladioli]